MPKLAAIQMNSTADVKENLAAAKKLIQQATADDAQLILLPENFALMGTHATDKLTVKETFGQGLIQDFLAQTARELNVWIIAGTIPIACTDPNRVRAASLVINAQGLCVARYDKIHLFDVNVVPGMEEYRESATIQAGEDVVVIDTPCGKLGLIVCYDVRFPELCRCLFNQGAEIISVPAAFTFKTGTAHWETLLRARAIENFCYVVGAGQTGTHADHRQTFGHSMIIEPWGSIISSLPENPGIITADIDLVHLQKIRQNIPVKQHQKIFCVQKK